MVSGMYSMSQQLSMLANKTWSGSLKTDWVEYLVVAGGGPGSGVMGGGGGGGAGGLLSGILSVVSGTSYTITIGAGGADTNPPARGSNSVFGSITAIGGGQGMEGGTITLYDNYNGGSGGGGAYGASNNSNPGGNGIVGQGNHGGAGQVSAASPYCSGGGGGAGTVGLVPPEANGGGNGGAGIASCITGTVTTYAGGGGGHTHAAKPNGVGGVGGGGTGDSDGSGATAGTANTGGGGGANSGANGKNGGSGIVIISYPDSFAAAVSTTGSPTITTSGSGSIFFNNTPDYFTIPNKSGFDFGSGAFTIECWVNLTSVATIINLFQIGTHAGGNHFVELGIANGYNIIGRLYDGSTYKYEHTSVDYTGKLNAWHHVAMVFTGSSVNIALDGVFGTPISYSGNDAPSGQSAYVGEQYNNGLSGVGYISNLRVVKGTAVYTGNFTPSTAPLTAISGTSLLLNTVSGSAFIDTSSSSSILTAVGTPSWNADSPFATGVGFKNRVYKFTSSGTITF